MEKFLSANHAEKKKKRHFNGTPTLLQLAPETNAFSFKVTNCPYKAHSRPFFLKKKKKNTKINKQKNKKMGFLLPIIMRDLPKLSYPV